MEQKYCARAKYIPGGDGRLRLAMVQGFTHPVFNPNPNGEKTKEQMFVDGETDERREIIGEEDDIERASRRARIAAFDKILCNPDLDTFVTFTFAPSEDFDRSKYEDVYSCLKQWLSNRVQRRGLKYVIAPERHKRSDGLHFHAIMNLSALRLERARSARTGRYLQHAGHPLYNVTDWNYGFSSAEIIHAGLEDRDKVAKYIFKYMGKELGKIGGRYLLSGGDFNKPVYIYSDSVENLCGSDCKFAREVSIPGGGTYMEYSFI